MNGSPFAVFRRNQRQLLVVLIGLSMFAFIFLDPSMMRNGQMPMLLGVLAVALLCSGGLWVVGAPRGKGGEFAIYGALIGAVVAFFGMRAQGNVTVATTQHGSFTRTDLQQLTTRRSLANRFIIQASNGAARGFGGIDDRSMVLRQMLLAEARQAGIHIDDRGINAYIKEVSDNKLSSPDFKKLLRELDVSEGTLYEVLKEELSAQMALQLDLPPRQRFGGGALQTPLTYWKQFQMLQVRQSLDAIAVPVMQFTSLIPEPKDDELRAYFEKFKDRPPTQDGQAGFLQPRRVQIGYVQAEFEAYEKLVPEATDEEVAEYYEANKQRYRVLDIPDSPVGPEMTPNFPEDGPASALSPENNKPADALPPAPGKPEDAAPAKEEPKAPEKKDPAATETEPEKNSPEKTEPEKKDGEEGNGCLLDEEPAAEKAAEEKSAATEKPEAPAKTEGDKPAEEQPKATEKPAAPEEAAEKKPDAPTTSKPPADPLGDLVLPPLPGAKPDAPALPEPKYRTLDDNLKAEIRETMLKDRAFAKMGEAVERAFEEMLKIVEPYLQAETDEAREKLAKEFTGQLKKYAEANQLQYIETKYLAYEELISGAGDAIGVALEPSSSPFSRGTSVADAAFGSEVLFTPGRADSSLRDKRYAYWKIGEQPSKAPELADEKIKEQVLEAWKYEQARPLAEKRAQELAQIMRKADKPLTDAFAGLTINGKEDGTPVVVHETPRFTWLNVPRNVPFQFMNQMPPPQISMIDGIDQPGNAFMKTVFEDLGPNDVGVAANQLRSAYYVVRVKQRDTAPGENGDNLGLKSLQQQFLIEGRTGFFNPAYFALAQGPQSEIDQQWREGLEQRFGIVWMDDDIEGKNMDGGKSKER